MTSKNINPIVNDAGRGGAANNQDDQNVKKEEVQTMEAGLNKIPGRPIAEAILGEEAEARKKTLRDFEAMQKAMKKQNSSKFMDELNRKLVSASGEAGKSGKDKPSEFERPMPEKIPNHPHGQPMKKQLLPLPVNSVEKKLDVELLDGKVGSKDQKQNNAGVPNKAKAEHRAVPSAFKEITKKANQKLHGGAATKNNLDEFSKE